MQLVVKIPAEKISDWASFHDVFKSTLGFPDFYGSNVEAWIDCMTSIDSADDGLSKITVAPGSILILQIEDVFRFRDKCPEQYNPWSSAADLSTIAGLSWANRRCWLASWSVGHVKSCEARPYAKVTCPPSPPPAGTQP